jgi:hypothetical protein
VSQRLLIACEESGVVREAMRRRGIDAVSCDLLDTAITGPHVCGDVVPLLRTQWAGVIAFPPCTHLASSGARWFPAKRADGRQAAAIAFFLLFTKLDCPWAIENPVGIMSTKYRKPDQIIQPWQHGHGETKATCLWLSGLPVLTPTRVVHGREPRVWKCPPSPDRSRIRSRTFEGIAEAMADQWSECFKRRSATTANPEGIR